MKLHPKHEDLAGYSAGSLDARTHARVGVHLRECARCHAHIRELRVLLADLEEALSPEPSPRVWTAIAARVEKRELVLLPADEVDDAEPQDDNDDHRRNSSGAARLRRRLALPSRWIGLAAVAMAAVLAGLLLIRPDTTMQTPGMLYMSPERPRAGDVIAFAYVPLSPTRGERLRLSARARTQRSPLEKAYTRHVHLADLRRQGSVFQGNFVMPDSLVYAVLEIENADGTKLTGPTQHWELLLHGPDGRPTQDALLHKLVDIGDADPTAAVQTARLLAELYPDRPQEATAWLRTPAIVKIGPAAPPAVLHELAEAKAITPRAIVPTSAVATPLFWQHLAAVADTTELTTLLHEPAAMQRALAYLRLYQITGVESYGEAAEALAREELQIRGDDSWLHFVLGEVLARRAPRRFPTRAADELRTAIRLDSQNIAAITAFARLATASGRRELVAEAQQLGDRVRSNAADPALHTALLDLDRTTGRDSSVASRETVVEQARAAAAASPASGHALYNLAGLQLSDPETRDAGYRNYLAAADLRDEKALGYIRADLLLAGDRDRLPLLEQPGLLPSQVLHAFWTARAMREGRTPAERLAEHFRRMAHARTHFSRVRAWAAEADTLYRRSGYDFGFDQRGQVYVRYGEPHQRYVHVTTASYNAESWFYNFPERPAMGFFFNAGMLTGVNCNTLGSGSGVGGNQALAYLKCRSGDRVELEMRRINALYAQELDASLRDDAFAWRFDQPIDYALDVFGFRDQQKRPEFMAVFAAPANPALRTAEGAYAFDVRWMVADSGLNAMVQLDTTIAINPGRRLNRNEAIRAVALLRLDRIELPFYRFMLRSTSDSTVGQIVGASLPRDLRASFALSDIVLADTTSRGTFARGDVRLSLIPARAFGGGAFQVFYEMYGLAPGAEYETTLSVQRSRGALDVLLGRADEFTMRFRGNAGTSESWRHQEVRRISSELPPGEYKLTVHVRDLTARRDAERTTTFRILGSR